ncbi:cation transporter [Devosia limi DSM 17137]|uniref:Cation diffusion facilitator family transporter n=1 Tax=Devosia limi DSM 17137 TaxID=1121477 RepID=A0A0F5LQV5_9HYPH|nr:CDF family Co(II)/Ni(II) efflux transporter DmeF [Devosia limi]KKB84686.1 cation transporter [Devosia limi DSM 17137]SHF54043.1 cation diffusion facilitator family transporter [Devosia limi DSM 17137]
MTDTPSRPFGHEHVFLGTQHARNERRTWAVIALTTVMMVAEIVAGSVYGSMALVADGWHMATHAAALLIAALAYVFSRRHARNRRFTFGTGKLGDLAGFASAIVLALIALLIGWESLLRFSAPVTINFNQAIVVAVIGLTVNLVCAWLLRDDDHRHGSSHAHHDHPHENAAHQHQHTDERHRDNNLRAAYLHVLADALTSVLAIFALVAGSVFGWLWLDPAIGILGSLVIARWSWGLMRDAGAVLVDYLPEVEELPEQIRSAIEVGGDEIYDLHVWQVGPGHHGAIVSLRSASPRAPTYYRELLSHLPELSHLTFEVEQA